MPAETHIDVLYPAFEPDSNEEDIDEDEIIDIIGEPLLNNGTMSPPGVENLNLVAVNQTQNEAMPHNHNVLCEDSQVTSPSTQLPSNAPIENNLSQKIPFSVQSLIQQ